MMHCNGVHPIDTAVRQSSSKPNGFLILAFGLNNENNSESNQTVSSTIMTVSSTCPQIASGEALVHTGFGSPSATTCFAIFFRIFSATVRLVVANSLFCSSRSKGSTGRTEHQNIFCTARKSGHSWHVQQTNATGNRTTKFSGTSPRRFVAITPRDV